MVAVVLNERMDERAFPGAPYGDGTKKSSFKFSGESSDTLALRFVAPQSSGKSSPMNDAPLSDVPTQLFVCRLVRSAHE